MACVVDWGGDVYDPRLEWVGAEVGMVLSGVPTSWTNGSEHRGLSPIASLPPLFVLNPLDG